MRDIRDNSIRPADPLPAPPAPAHVNDALDADAAFRSALEDTPAIVREAYMARVIQCQQLSSALLTTNQQVQRDISFREYIIEQGDARCNKLTEQLVTCRVAKAAVKRALRLTREAANARINQLEAQHAGLAEQIAGFEAQIRHGIEHDVIAVLDNLSTGTAPVESRQQVENIKSFIRSWILPAVRGNAK